ncbi:hypothetical protein HGRIS_006651 [Hohenbuehelia grisea]|uniref:Uncharacterized protein n=1 Tax=Hohenbuehelia grisea TaxID=104357 RepID=A0ABR3J9P5_9AGAR
MWSKLTHALRPRQESDASTSSGEVMARVYQQHPNLSVFQESNVPESPIPPPSPPSSPSKHGRMGMFKRLSKAPFKDEPESIRASSPSLRLLPKKVKSTLNLNGNNSQHSLSRASGEATRSSAQELPRRPSYDALRPSVDLNPPSLRRTSRDMLREASLDEPSAGRPIPSSLVIDTQLGSVRSILRDPNTPGTGQNVRFFARDAYKVISPEQSVELEQQPVEPGSFLDRLQQTSPEADSPSSGMPRGKSRRPSVADVFSPLMESQELEPPQLVTDESNLFNISEHIELPPIPAEVEFKIEEPSHVPFDVEPLPASMTSTPFKLKPKEGKGKAADDTIFHSLERSPQLPPMLHDRSQSFSFGQTVFFSLNKEPNPDTSSGSADVKDTSSDIGPAPRPKSRSRALSDTVFQNMIREPTKPPEADINDESSSDLVVYAPPTQEPDPFRADANTYYTPLTNIPVTPPKSANFSTSHARTASKEESMIYSLQAQLSLQTDLCGHYESDIRARDEVVAVLSKKVEAMEKDDAKRRGVLRTWKKKVAELERACRYLEEEVDNSRHASMERSVMDEASSEALRMLHRQIASLEREKAEWVRKEEAYRGQLERVEGAAKTSEAEAGELREVLRTRDESARELQAGILEARAQMEIMGNTSLGMIDEEELRRLTNQQEQKSGDDTQRYRAAVATWEEEKAELMAQAESMDVQHQALEDEIADLRDQLKNRDEAYDTLKAELEAQWTNTEKHTDHLREVEKEKEELIVERNGLKEDLDELERRLQAMEAEWDNADAKRTELEAEIDELWAMKTEMEQEREQLTEQLRQAEDHSTQVARELEDRDERIESLTKDFKFAQENASRLELNVQQRDSQVEEYVKRIVQREDEAEELREQLANIQRVHARALSDSQRELQDALALENDARQQLEQLLKAKTELDVESRTLKERVSTMDAEVEKLRRQLHELKQESADKEVKIAQLSKQRSQDKDDMQGLNIALDSKQQELELLKRKLGVRGTAGSTPAGTATSTHHRRDSSVFSTPMSRPSSIISDSGLSIKAPKGLDTPAAKIPALGKSTRVNTAAGSAAPGSSVVKTAKSRIEGSMGPPPMKGRVSLAGTPTPAARVSSLARTASNGPSAFPPLPASRNLRRTSSASSTSDTPGRSAVEVKLRQAGRVPQSPISSSSDLSEKENKAELSSARRRSMIPTPT